MSRTVGVGVCVAMLACGDNHAKDIPAKYAAVAEVHHAQCGNCHMRVEPGQRTRAQFEKALVRHHTRVKLTDDQWPLLVDYLSQTP